MWRIDDINDLKILRRNSHGLDTFIVAGKYRLDWVEQELRNKHHLVLHT